MARRTLRSIGLTLLVAAALSSVTGAVRAQSSPAPAAVRLPADTCLLASTKELSAIHAEVTLTLAIATPGACNYAGSPPDRPFAGAYLTVEARPASLQDVALAGDARDVTIAGHDGRVGSRDVIVLVGPWLMRINGIIPTPDPSAWLTSAAEIAVPRLAAQASADAQGPICARLGAPAVQAILGVPIERVVGNADSCTWASDDASADLPSYVNVDARVETGDLETAGIAFEDVEDVDVGGRKGVWMESEQRLLVETGSGGLVTVKFVVAPDAVATRDHAIALAAALFEVGAA